MRKTGILLLAVVLCGCARLSDFTKETDRSERETKKEDTSPAMMTCTGEKNDTLIFEAKGDQIQKLTQKFTMSFSELGISEELDAQSVQNKINESLSAMYQDIKGIEVSGVMKEDHVEITLVIDYAAANDQQLIDAGLLQEGKRDSEHISLKQSQENYEKSGYTCTVE